MTISQVPAAVQAILASEGLEPLSWGEVVWGESPRTSKDMTLLNRPLLGCNRKLRPYGVTVARRVLHRHRQTSIVAFKLKFFISARRVIEARAA